MESKDILLLVIAGIVTVTLIIYLVRKNRNDIITMNPDAPDAVEETHGDQERRADKT